MSKEKKEQLMSVHKRYWPVLLLTAIAIGLIIGGFFAPPYGRIDGSVLTASGEIFAFAALIVYIVRAEAGADLSLKKGDLEVAITNDAREEEENDKEE